MNVEDEAVPRAKNDAQGGDIQELRAVDRRTLVESSRGKTAKFPRTDRRADRIGLVLRRRQPDLTLVLENVHDPHNVSAVLRSCDAVGIVKVHLVYSDEDPPNKSLARTTSASATKWIEVERYSSIEMCYQNLRPSSIRILATAFGQGSKDLYETDFRLPTALVFGNEHRGLTEEAIGGADGQITIPMLGMVQSLNISIACAVTLYEAMRQRRAAGHYDAPKLDEAELELRTTEWLKK